MSNQNKNNLHQDKENKKNTSAKSIYKNRKLINLIVTILLIVVAFVWQRYFSDDVQQPPQNNQQNSQQNNHQNNQQKIPSQNTRPPIEGPRVDESQEELIPVDVLRVVDGDTLIVRLDGRERRLRLIGINAPESVPDNPERITREGILSSAYLEQLIKNYKGQYHIEFDVEAVDQYDRLLGYLWMGNTLLNEKLCYDGFAYAKSYPPNTKYDIENRSAAEDARFSKRGIWGDLDALEAELLP